MKWWVPVLGSRICMLLLQVVFNLFPDHKADAFNPDQTVPVNFSDHVVKYFLDGFHKWDAKYFIYIAENGYVEEQMFAFFPLLPLCIRYIGHIIFITSFHFISLHYCYLLAGFSINTIMFMGSASALYKLTDIIFSNKKFSMSVLWLFCFNPASIFFSAIYTEAAYSCFVFNAMVNLVEYRGVMATMWFTLASCTRSNGVVNIFFVAYYQLRLIVNEISTAKGYSLKKLCISLACTASSCLSILVPFVVVNAYGYSRFCHSSDSTAVWKPISNCSTLPEFCCSTLPLIYQHVQKYHWQLGFLSYYQFRKLPNFILATPIVYTVLYGTIKYMAARRHEILNLGLLSNDCSVRVDTKYAFASRNIFCFAVNAFVLITFSLLFMHVEVSTRFLFSSSPFPYWVMSSYIFKDYLTLDLSIFSWRDFTKFSVTSQLVFIYSISYFVLGAILHVNFLPWT